MLYQDNTFIAKLDENVSLLENLTPNTNYIVKKAQKLCETKNYLSHKR